jgi:hypothetical protein
MRVMMTEIGNASSGDEAICIGAVRRLSAMGSRVTFLYRVSLEASLQKAGVFVHSIHMPLEEEFEGIDTMYGLVEALASRMPDKYTQIRNLLLQHDIVAIAPGGRFTDGLKNARSLAVAAIALSMNIPVAVLHQSIGPVDNAAHRRLITEVFSRCRLVLARDECSIKFLGKLGISDDRLVPCRDVAMGETYPLRLGAPEYDLGVNVRHGFNGHLDLQALSTFIQAYIAARPGARVLVYSTTFNLRPDLIAHLSSLPCDAQVHMPPYPDYLNQVGRCAINISDSLHGVLFSMLAGRPVIACQSDFKTWKLKGIPGPHQEPLEVLPGLISTDEAMRVLDRLLAVEGNPERSLDRQRQIVEYGRRMCEAGWVRVQDLIQSIP